MFDFILPVIFRKVVKEIDDSTVLIVIGDHGMTETGEFFICCWNFLFAG